MSIVNEWQHLKIPFDEIKVATESFKTFIGEGGYGKVYKGKLLVSGKETKVAVKRLNEQSMNRQGSKEFLTEIQSLSGQQHPNLISLVGFCDEGREMSIVYEFAERGSLDQYLRRSRKTTSTTLTWLQRLKICVDAARGLDHLHSHVGGHRTIIHRDIKSSNILIDENWVAKISDLGLSKLSTTGFGMSVIVTNGCGTNGYCDPEYYTTGILTKKSDVYSFGVVLFEVLCGRLCLSDSDDGFSLSSRSAKYHYKKNSLDKIMDGSLWEHIGSYSMTKFAAIAHRCLDDDREQRPAMDVVLKELEEALKYQEEYEFQNEWQRLKIPFDEIKVASENFKTLIGQGGYGWVYKGKLLVSGKETMVAIKWLNKQFGHGLKEFSTEIQLLYFGQQHPNLISLVGYCDEGEKKAIIYEYAERGSLDQYIRHSGKSTSPTTTLTWLQRLKICVDAARGLDHLHSHVGGPRAIIHRDIKSSNILIDKNWVGKISDVGLSKLSVTDFGMSDIVSNGCGTQGYCEPEYNSTGVVTKKSDVYSFGVVLFEVLCGRLCLIDSDDGFLLSSKSAKYHYEKNSLYKIMDDSLREHMGSYSMTKFAAIAYRCLDDDRKQRPAMDVVVKELEEAVEYQEEYEFENEKKSKSIVVVEDNVNTDEYWETKLPGDMSSLIKKFKIPQEVYTNKKELFSYLQEGISFDGDYKFLWINNDGKKCLLISSRGFIMSENDQYLTWDSLSDSRFKVVANYSQNFQNIKCRIKTSMLSLGTMYEASLVFKYEDAASSRLFKTKWKTDELNVHSINVGEMRKDNWCTIKLWNFFNHVPNAEFDIVIDELAYCENPVTSSILIQGIEFQPIKMCEGFKSLSKEDDIDDDEYWEKKLPENYECYIKMSDEPLDYTTKKELYQIFCHGFLADKGKLWFSICKSTHGICSLLSSANKISGYHYRTTSISLSESRFWLVKKLGDHKYFFFKTTLESVMFSPQYTYACYLLFKFRDDNPRIPDNTVLFETECELDGISMGTMISYWSMYPMNIPTIKPKNDYGSHDSSNILKAQGLAMKKVQTEHLGYSRIEEKKDGWMEAMLCKPPNKLQDQKNGCYLQIKLTSTEDWKVDGMIIEGIEFRPYI